MSTTSRLATRCLPIGCTLLGLVLVLGSCGTSGGGGDEEPGDAPDAPVLHLAILGGDALRFTWTNVADETRYRILEDPDGASGYTQVGATAVDLTYYTHPVALADRLDARYVVEACNDHGCSRSLPVAVADALTSAFTYIKASNTSTYGRFGGGMALSGDGDTLAVGSSGEGSGAQGCKHPGDSDYESSQADDGLIAVGAVYVFRRDGDTWVQEAYIKASNAEVRDGFGSSVTLSADGDTLAVGAPGEDGDSLHGLPDNSVLDSGAVYVFTRWAGRWSPEGYLKAQDVRTESAFGMAVTLSGEGDTLAVGAPYRDVGPLDEPVEDVGGAYVFVRDASFWYQQARLDPPVVEATDRFGYQTAVSHDGDVVAVAWAREDSNGTSVADNSAEDAGAVMVYARSGSTWDRQWYLKASTPDAGDRFGVGVALSADGRVLAVGAPYEGSDGMGGETESTVESGAVYVFEFDDTDWLQAPEILKAPTVGRLDHFGGSVALSADGLALLVGATGEDSSARGLDGNMADDSMPQSGAAYLYRRVAGPFLPSHYIKAPNPGENDSFGWIVAMADDGVTFAVAAPQESSGATGIDGAMHDDTAPFGGAVYHR